MQIYILCGLMVTAVVFAANYSPEDYIAGHWINPILPMVYVDNRYRYDALDKIYPQHFEFFYDRLVSISFELSNEDVKPGQSPFLSKATGVFVTDNLVLTSSNPYREICQKRSIKNMFLFFIRGRIYNSTKKPTINNYKRVYVHTYHLIHCARPVVPWTPDDFVRIDMHHGMHRPTHDLMTFRFFPRTKMYDPPPPEINTMEAEVTEDMLAANLVDYYYPAGAIITPVASKQDAIKQDVRFASTAFINDEHIKSDGYLEPCNITYADNLIVSCIHWFPRSWGHHICIKNVFGYRGLGSGATLFQGEKLIGLGCFALFKEKGSILVFTDVRPYHSLIHKTCTEEDQVYGNGLVDL